MSYTLYRFNPRPPIRPTPALHLNGFQDPTAIQKEIMVGQESVNESVLLRSYQSAPDIVSGGLQEEFGNTIMNYKEYDDDCMPLPKAFGLSFGLQSNLEGMNIRGGLEQTVDSTTDKGSLLQPQKHDLELNIEPLTQDCWHFQPHQLDLITDSRLLSLASEGALPANYIDMSIMSPTNYGPSGRCDPLFSSSQIEWDAHPISQPPEVRPGSICSPAPDSAASQPDPVLAVSFQRDRCYSANETGNNTPQNSGLSGSRVFACGLNDCTRAYKRKYELQRHQRKHTGLRPYGCRLMTCDRAGQNGFARKDHLKQHLRQVHHVES